MPTSYRRGKIVVLTTTGQHSAGSSDDRRTVPRRYLYHYIAVFLHPRTSNFLCLPDSIGTQVKSTVMNPTHRCRLHLEAPHYLLLPSHRFHLMPRTMTRTSIVIISKAVGAHKMLMFPPTHDTFATHVTGIIFPQLRLTPGLQVRAPKLRDLDFGSTRNLHRNRSYLHRYVVLGNLSAQPNDHFTARMLIRELPLVAWLTHTAQ
jgi:hypothetical protein